MARRKLIPPLWLLVAAFILLAAILRPWEAIVPLNDDWSYLIPTLRLARDGVLRVTGDSPTTHVLHVLIGALWLKIFGGGIGGLKILMFLWHFTGAFFLLRLLREEKVSPALALLGALTYVFNPILLTLSVSFMTDIPYIALVTVSLYAYLRAMREGRDRWILYGSLAAGGAYLIKQLGLFMPVALTLVLWHTCKIKRRRLALAWAPVVFAFAAHQIWFHFLHPPIWAGTVDGVYIRAFRLMGDPAALLRDGTAHLTGLMFHCALFLLPLLAGFAADSRRLRSLRPKPLHAVFIVLGVIAVARAGKFPYLENTFYYTGIGTPTPFHTDFKAAGVFGFPGFWEGVTAVTFLGALLLLSLLPAFLREHRRHPAALLLAYTALFQLGVSLVTTKYMDRYTLYGFPALVGLLCLAASRGRFAVRAAWGVLALCAGIFVCAAADYSSWNNAKWRLGRRAVARGMVAAPEAIQGGHDWDMYWTYEKRMAELAKTKPLEDIREWEWLEEMPREAFISFAPPKLMGRGRLIFDEPYETPLRAGPAFLYLYRGKTIR